MSASLARMRSSPRPARALPLAILALGLAGCVGYQPGFPGAGSRVGSVFVAPVHNETDFPELSAPVGAAIREALAARPGWTLAPSGQANSVLHARIVGLDRELAAVRSDDVGRGQKFELVFRALVTLRPADESQPPLFENRVVLARRDVFAGESLIDAERQAGPVVAQELGLRIAQAASDVW